jgi:hypothetical protein
MSAFNREHAPVHKTSGLEKTVGDAQAEAEEMRKGHAGVQAAAAAIEDSDFIDEILDTEDHGQGDGELAQQKRTEVEEDEDSPDSLEDDELASAVEEMLGKTPKDETEGEETDETDDVDGEEDAEGEDAESQSPEDADPAPRTPRSTDELIEALGGEDAVFKIKAGGEEVEASAQEIVNGYQRHADYTRGTQRNAETRRALEADAETLRDQGFKYAERMQTLEQVMSATGADQALIQQVQAEQARVQDALAHDMELQTQRRLANQSSLLLEALPDFDKKAVAEHAMEFLGLEPEDLSGLEDYRAIVLLDRSRRLAEIEAGTVSAKEAVRGKVKKAKRQLKPGHSRPEASRARKAKKQAAAAAGRLKQTGSIGDAQNVLMGLLDDE